ncbi:MAG: DUF1800 family protein [Bacteroidota bacterium]
MRDQLNFHCLILFFMATALKAQVYDDYLGAGHMEGIMVMSSSNSGQAQANNTINGSGLEIDEYGAARFLGYASLGADYETIQHVAEQGVSDWLDAQFAMAPAVSFKDTTWMIWEHFWPQYVDFYGYDFIVNHGDAVIPYWFYWKMAWWNNILKSDDHVRQRTAQALSQIFVISEKSNLQLSGPGMADYYDLLYKNAFGNFRDLLYDISLHPMMGFYLSHINNPKSDAANNIHPDENYAREIMQLFSIGLFELNNDGTRKIDTEGNFIPTYDNEDIKEFAKIFTGLAPSGYYWPWEDYSWLPAAWGEEFNNSPAFVVTWEPMIPFENWHEPGEKRLLNGQVVPAGQTTLEDIDDAIDNLFNHPNVGPFIGKLLIQRLVKSNPTPAYVSRVANKFNDNGNGTRGDMQAVIRAILTDAEALDCSWIEEEQAGKLREPLLRYTQALRAFNAYNQSGKLWNWGYLFDDAVSQGILASPSVFNFYLPEFQPNGPIADQDLFAPEFQIHTSATSINFINLAYDWFVNDYYGEIATHVGAASHNSPSFEIQDLDPADYIYLDLDDEYNMAYDAPALVERFNLMLTGGLLSENTKTSIINSVEQLSDPVQRVRAALFLSFIAPEYAVQK